MPRILLFLSTGRCGTQYITKLFSEVVGNSAVVSHEPLRAKYNPRKYLRAKSLSRSLLLEPKIMKHFRSWDEALRAGKSVIETGWPVFPWLPYIEKRYEGRVDIVHLLRDPKRFAFSQASHGYYSGRRNDQYTKLAALTPSDPGVKNKYIQGFWPDLNAVERCLFQWLEINEYAEELNDEGLISSRWRSEDIFLSPGLFLDDIRGLNSYWATVIRDTAIQSDIVDQHRYVLSESMTSIRQFVPIEHLAVKYGYDMNIEILDDELIDRFYPDGQP